MRVDIGEGVRLFFDVTGTALDVDGSEVREKPTLIVLHGGPGFDHTTMRPWFDRFGDVAQVVWYDHRGQGRSDGWDDRSRWNMDTWADDVVRVCDALGITAPVVLGNSFGGMVAMHYAARHPDHPSKLVLSSTAARKNIARIVGAFRRMYGDDVATIAEAFWNDPTAETRTSYMETCLPLYTVNRVAVGATSIMNHQVSRHFIVEEEADMDLLPGLANITCPTLVLAGEQDPVCTMDDALEIVDAIPHEHVRFERFEQCGHGTYRDQSERTEAVLREFLAAV